MAASQERAVDGGRRPFAGLTWMHTLNGSWSANAFYVLTEPASSSGARRVAGARYYVVLRDTGGPTAPTTEQWADSRTCPGVTDMLLAMEGLPPVRPDAPGLGQEGDFVLTADGIHHLFWTRSARSGPDDTRVQLEISGNVDSPVALWWEKASEGLETCWSSTPPAGLAGER